MKRPAIFFDRDNTLIAADAYLGDPDKVVLMDGAAAAVARARQLGFATVVVSNQSGVARGMFDEEAVHAVNARLDELLAASHPGAVIDKHSFCPYHPDASIAAYRHDSQLRKPKPGMILEAARTLALDLSRSWVVGDAPRDIEAGAAAGCRTILFHNPQIAQSPAAIEATVVAPEFTVSTLKEAIDYIERHLTATDEPASPTTDEGDELVLPAPQRPDTTASSPAIRLLAQPAVPGTGKPAPTKPTAPQADKPTPPATSRLESLAEQILHEIKRQHEQPYHDFSVPKLLSGVIQVLALGALVFAYFHENLALQAILVALFLQVLTATLLLMGRK
jgi:D-glycero-D-manno-heptose 1,7-bisphosphate phosphatase